MNYVTVICILIIAIAGIFVFQDAFRTYFTHEILACYITYFTFAEDYYIPECFYSNAFGHFPEYFIGKKGVYRPLITCMFATEYTLWGMNPLPYHITNYLVHLINALLVFILMNYFLRNKPFAMLASACFFFHPWNASPVIVLLQRSGIVCTTFYLTAILCFIRYRISEVPEKKWLYVFVISALCAVLSYEMSITLPFMVLYLDLFFFRKKNRTGWYTLHIYLFLGLIAYILFRLTIFHGVGGYPGQDAHSPHLMVSNIIFKNFLGYVTGFLSQCMPYPSIFAAILVILLFLAIVISTIMDKVSGYAIFWIILTPLPIINIGMNSYYFYLPSIGLTLLIYAMLNYLFINILGSVKAFFIICCVGIVMVSMGAASIQREFHQIRQDNKDTMNLVDQIHAQYPDLPDHARIYMVIPQLKGRDKLNRTYYDISMEHLIQLKYNNRTIRCYPLPIGEKNLKYSNPDNIIFSDTSYFLQRVGNEVREVHDVKHLLRSNWFRGKLKTPSHHAVQQK